MLARVSFEVRAGELLSLIGPQRRGKTSILNCIGGIYRPSQPCRIVFDGRDVTGTRPHAMARLGLARTFQHGELFGHMTVLENLLVARHARVSTSVLGEGLWSRRTRRAEVEHRRVVEEILAFVELTRYRHQPVSALPFGIQKLVAIGRALAVAPTLLLLDEPSTGMNREEKENLARFMLRIKHELGTTMLWIEHDMELVADLADACTCDFGSTWRRDSRHVLRDPRVVDAYLGRRGGPAPGV